MTTDGIPHGTPAGYEAGCRGYANCPNFDTNGQSCAQARIRYNGDHAYRKLVDGGAAVEVLQVREVFTAEVTPKPKARPKPPAPRPVEPDLAQWPDNDPTVPAPPIATTSPASTDHLKHGTSIAYSKYGCRCAECRAYKSRINHRHHLRRTERLNTEFTDDALAEVAARFTAATTAVEYSDNALALHALADELDDWVARLRETIGGVR